MNPQFLITMPHRENNIGLELNMGEKHDKINGICNMIRLEVL